jgi:hypothetical protein
MRMRPLCLKSSFSRVQGVGRAFFGIQGVTVREWVGLVRSFSSECLLSLKVPPKPRIVVYFCNPNIWEADAGGS